MEANKSKGIKYRGFNKSNLLNWLILLEKNGYVMCSFRNCNFMAFGIEEMADHYSRCNSDKSNIKFTCEHCSGGIDTEDNMLKHIVLHHPQHANFKDFSEFTRRESSLFPSSTTKREVSNVLSRSWQLFLESKRYIKCLVPTCLYVANSVEQMSLHFHHNCTPHLRDQLSYTCFSCHGRTGTLSELKAHCEAAHPVGKVETNPITSPIIHHWSENLRKYNWAKCFNAKCNFIECDIATLKAHYSTCINPSKNDLVECSKCRGWLNGFSQLRKHISMAHNPYNPYPNVYMVPVVLINNTLLPTSDSEVKRALSLDSNPKASEELFKMTQSMTNSLIWNKEGIPPTTIIPNDSVSVQSGEDGTDKSEDVSVRAPKIFDNSIELESFSENELTSVVELNNEKDLKSPEESNEAKPVNKVDTSKSESAPLKKSRPEKRTKKVTGAIVEGDTIKEFSIDLESDSDQEESTNFEPYDPVDGFDVVKQAKKWERMYNESFEGTPPLKVNEAKRTYKHSASVIKKLPHIYTPYIPKSTNGIDCTNAQKAQVTFTKEAIDANRWKLDLPHVTIHNRKSSSRARKKAASSKSTSILSKIADEIANKQGPLVPVSIKVTDTGANWTIQVPNINLHDDNNSELDLQSKTNRQSVKSCVNFKEKCWDSIETDLIQLLNISVKNSSIRNPIRYHSHNTRNNPRPQIVQDDNIGRLFEDFKTRTEEESIDDPKEELDLSSDKDSDCDDLFIDEPADLSNSNDDDEESQVTRCSSKSEASRGGWCVKLVEPSQSPKHREKTLETQNKSVDSNTKECENGVKTLSDSHPKSKVPSLSSEHSNLSNDPSEQSISPSKHLLTEESNDSCLSENSHKSVIKDCVANSEKNCINNSNNNALICDNRNARILGLNDSLCVNKQLINNVYSKNDDSGSNFKSSSNEIDCSRNVLVAPVINNSVAKKVESSGKVESENVISKNSDNVKSIDTKSSNGLRSSTLILTSCQQEVEEKKKPSSVCSDGIHCGTDDESVGSPDRADDLENDRLSNDETNGENSSLTLNDNSMSDQQIRLDDSITNESTSHASLQNEDDIIPEILIKSELTSEEQSDESLEEGEVDSVSLQTPKGRKRKKSNDTSLSKAKQMCPSNEISTPLSADSSLNEDGTPSERSVKRRGRKPKNQSIQLVNPSTLLEGTEPLGRTRRRRIPIGGNLIVPDQHFVNENSPVPSAIVNVNNDSIPVEVDERFPRARRPKNKRSVDIMSALGERVTPTSPLPFPDKKVTCAVCSETMSVKVYQSKHLLQHNFLCWLLDEMPLPLDDFNTMVLVANRGKRAYPGFTFTCEKCKRACKSSSGYLCHIRFCGKSKIEADSLMVACCLCSRLLKPNGVDQHMRQAHSRGPNQPELAPNLPSSVRSSAIKSKAKISELVGILSSQEEVDTPKTSTSLEKVNKLNRVITKKLLASWKEAHAKGSPLFCPVTNCDFTCHCYYTIQSHYRACNPLDPSQQIFECKQCSYQTNFKESYITHMREDHCLIIHLSENSAHYPIHFLKELEDSIYCSFSWIRCATVFKPCLQLTKELREKVLSLESLFPDLLVNWDNWVSLEDENPYYQPDYHTSPAVRYNSTNEWLRLPCYSAASFKGESLLWTGGCVHSMAWCPIPSNIVSDQFLAVSCLLNFNQVFLLGNTYKQPTTIQLWNYGPLLNSENPELNGDLSKTPMLSYALCIDDGPVWDIEWCSSGCFDLRRLGLLACATASGSVNIYSLPHPSQLNIPAERCPLFKGVPTLRLMFSRNEKFQCQKVSWSKVKPHKLIAGGYVNGFIAVWDLNISSTFLREGSVIYPCRLFQAHHSSVTCLRMCPVDNNFVLSGSTDKYIKLWDVRDVSNPIHSMARGGITDMDWLSHWIGFCYGMDAGLTPSPSSAFFASVRDFSFLSMPFIGHPTASVKSISGNDWLNCVVTGYDDGNVILTSCLRQFGDGSDSKKKIAKFILRTELVDLAREKPMKSGSKIGPEEDGLPSVPDDSSSYEDTINMFGISISTSKGIEDKGKLEPVEEPRNDVFPIHSVTKVCFNPNQNSFLMVAVGFESGFITGLQLVPSRQVTPDIQALSTTPNKVIGSQDDSEDASF